MGYHGTTDGVILLAAHFFLVDSTRQTSFGWHTGDDDLNIISYVGRRSLRSAVIQLGAQTRTAMQVYLFAPFAFQGRGAGALFHGTALHRSVSLDPLPQDGVWKLTLFFLLPEDQTSSDWL